MRWNDMRESGNVEDRRNEIGGGGPASGGLFALLLNMLGFKRVALIVVAVIGVGLLLGKSPVDMLRMLGLVGPAGQRPAAYEQGPRGAADNEQHREMVARILGDTEDSWGRIFQQNGKTYAQPSLVLFRDQVRSGCGGASSAVGPFYCPADSKVYLDLGFFDELHKRFGASGDFAQAYVIAHEVGHHVQNLLGTSAKVHERQQRVSKAQANALSVQLELQADCYAGVWGHSAQQRGLLEAGDLDEALNAAHAIGDDTLQTKAGGAVVPDSFTHGSSAERKRWFKRGFESGDPAQCNTFQS
ncbi:KPN_02809 family neutral zinc metallopeptidase [Chitinilyticum litopenaei]|uniref:KPN_02809 family neutral zinc metallopeptidase n=1 Tax=Chitinilyticum litopenaei TaxID=1121276 RepID=UPI000421A112|nr:neutral zinc metallopeptidase [Chitinilyticum litopenaei]